MDILELQNLITNPSDSEQFDTLVAEAENLLDSGEIAERVDFVSYLSDIFMRFGDSISQADPKKYDLLQTYWALLSFTAFVGFSAPDQDSLLQKRLFYAIQKGFDTDDLTNQFYRLLTLMTLLLKTSVCTQRISNKTLKNLVHFQLKLKEKNMCQKYATGFWIIQNIPPRFPNALQLSV